MLFIKFLSPIAVLAIGIIHIAVQEKWYKCHDARRKVHKRVIIFLITVMSFCTIATCMIVRHDANEASELTSLVEGLRSDNGRLKHEVERLHTDNKELKHKSDEIMKSTTGGGSFCYLYPFFLLNKGENLFGLVINHEGDYPIQNLSMNVADIDKLLEIQEQVLLSKNIEHNSDIALMDSGIPFDLHVKYAESYQAFQVGTLSPTTPPMFFGIRTREKNPVNPEFYERWIVVSEEASFSLRIRFIGSNGTFEQDLNLCKINNKWKIASKVIATDMSSVKKSTVLHEEIDPDFPRNAEGNVDWEGTNILEILEILH